MEVEHQQRTWRQLPLFEAGAAHERPDASGDGGTEAAACEEEQATTALNRERALTNDLMERVCERENLNRAYIAWFRAQGLVSLSQRYAELQP